MFYVIDKYQNPPHGNAIPHSLIDARKNFFCNFSDLVELILVLTFFAKLFLDLVPLNYTNEKQTYFIKNPSNTAINLVEYLAKIALKVQLACSVNLPDLVDLQEG